MPRLFVITARERHTAIIIRRGPSKWYHLIQWNTRDDLFEHGAWIKGRIYEKKCDLSPDGRFFLYFLLPGSFHRDESLGHCWTAVSRAPWLYALTLWPGDTTYGGGGRFFDNFRIKLREKDEPHPQFPKNRIDVIDGPAPYHESSEEVEDADWCGRDQQDRVIFTRGGLLYRKEKSGGANMVADFTDLTPDPMEAPDWAKEPV